MKSLCLFTILTGIFTVAAGNLSWQTPGGSAAAEKDGIVSITGGSELISTNKIPVNPAKAYCYTGFIRCTDVSDAAIQFGIICFDKKNKICRAVRGSLGPHPALYRVVSGRCFGDRQSRRLG